MTAAVDSGAGKDTAAAEKSPRHAAARSQAGKQPRSQTRTQTRTRAKALLNSLEQRLDLLTSSLNATEIAEKSIDIVREIKELHGILRSLNEAAAPAEQKPRRLVVVWGQSESYSSSAAGPASAGTGKGSALRTPRTQQPLD